MVCPSFCAAPTDNLHTLIRYVYAVNVIDLFKRVACEADGLAWPSLCTCILTPHLFSFHASVHLFACKHTYKQYDSDPVSSNNKVTNNTMPGYTGPGRTAGNRRHDV